MSDEGSEFGAGIVVCLAKFSEHLHEHGPYSERQIREFADWTPQERGRCEAEALRYPVGDAAQKLARMASAERMREGDRVKALSAMIEMWMNGASDHLIDLDEKAPEPLKELAELALRIGHGFTGETWTMEHVKRIRELWKAASVAVDRMLGIEPDWGQW
ncbi:MAG TPA: hypothetical protein VMB51_05285 [Solirubrobacteraceae bacterium]|nr:hypothetical protein [Solirubrobacteraceae bacterium]